MFEFSVRVRVGEMFTVEVSVGFGVDVRVGEGLWLKFE